MANVPPNTRGIDVLRLLRIGRSSARFSRWYTLACYGASLIGLLAGVVEWFQVLSEDQAHGGTLTGSLGVGWNWGRRRHWGTELRYGALGRRLSATRGRLEWTLVRRL
jgi:hypothetical protein